MKLSIFNNVYMEQALMLAQIAANKGEIPVGAVLVNSLTNEIVATAHNMCETNRNPLLHAEMIVISSACQILQEKYLIHCDLYTTLEPCNLCATAISYSRVRRLYYAASDPKFGAVESISQFFHSKNCFTRPDVYSGLCMEKSVNILQKFFKKIRQ